MNYPSIFNDVIGPIMRGPSSSHCAGALRIGRLARDLMSGGELDDVLVEFEIGKFWRQFTIPEVIDQSQIDAEHKNGVLRLTLPKIEKAQPRKIEIKAA